MAKTQTLESFVSETAQRSQPSMTRPRLKSECEARLAEVDRRDAAKYASMETLTHQFNQVADAMEAEDAGDEWDEDSLVNDIEAVRAKLVG